MVADGGGYLHRRGARPKWYNNNNILWHPFLYFSLLHSIVYPQSYNLAVRQWNHNSNVFVYKIPIVRRRTSVFGTYCSNTHYIIITIHMHNIIIYTYLCTIIILLLLR